MRRIYRLLNIMISKNNKNDMKLYFVANIDNHGNSTNPHF